MNSKHATCSLCAQGCEPVQWSGCVRFNPLHKVSSQTSSKGREGGSKQEDVKGTSPHHDFPGTKPSQLKEGSGCSRSADHRIQDQDIPSWNSALPENLARKNQNTSQALVISVPLHGAFLKACYYKVQIGNQKDLSS